MVESKVLRIKRRIKTVTGNESTSSVGTENGTSEPESGIASPVESASVETDTSGATEYVDPATVAGNEPTDSAPRKGRGRPKGSKNGKETSQDLGSVLYSIHLMMGIMVAPELSIAQDEANELGKAVARVNDLFGGIVLPEKTLAVINLGIVATKIYGPRAVMIYKRVNGKPTLVADENDGTFNAISFPKPN